MQVFIQAFLFSLISIISVEAKVLLEIPNYNGSITFSIDDDLEFSKLIKNVEVAKIEYTRSGLDAAKEEVQMSEALVENYKNKLIIEILKINKEGARAGRSDGAMDGADLVFVNNSDKNPTDNANDFTGPNYKPKINHSKKIMEKVFADGYNYSYKLHARLAYLRALSTDNN